MNEPNNKPVIFLAFAQDREEKVGYLRNLPTELDGIRKALQKARQAGLCEVVERANTTLDNIFDVFQEFRDRVAVFHYGGHAGSFQLLLESPTGKHQLGHSEGLVSFLAKQKGLKLVFLNGCSSQKQALDMVEAGVPAVVGTSQKIADDVATQLSHRFYLGLAAGLPIDRAWNEAVDQVRMATGSSNFRDLFHDDETELEERFPWEIYYRKGAEIVKDWNLPEAVENPLFGLPPIPSTFDLPDTPFLFLRRYEREHARIFFGRSYYIRDIYNRISDPKASPLILLYGQSGVGKSSLFDAGLVPRLEQDYRVVYCRRNRNKGLSGTLQDVLEKEIETLAKEGALQIPEAEPPASQSDSAPEVSVIDKLEAIAQEAHDELRQELEQLIERLRTARSRNASDPQAAEDDVLKATSIDMEFFASLPIFLRLWLQIEASVNKPLVVIFDQVEEVFTNLNPEQPDELDDFLLALRIIFGSPAHRPQGKLLLGYRKEYHAEIEEDCKIFLLPRTSVFLEPLSRKDLLEIFRGITETDELRKQYHLTVEDDLPVTVADDLLEDKDSPVAPVLQILLTKMWNAAFAENSEAPHFTVAAYQQLKTEGIAMGEFFEQQMKQLRNWQANVVDSGLALDVLYFHTTSLGTAGSRSLDEIRQTYQHRQDVIDELVRKCKELFLLTETQAGQESKLLTLTHDTLAPVVTSRYSQSDKPGQRAVRILSNKINDFRLQQESVWLDEADLEIVEKGTTGMRTLEIDEKRLLEISRQRKEQLERERRRNRQVRQALVTAILIFAIVAVWQWRTASEQRNIAQTEAANAKSTLLALQAEELAPKDRTRALWLADSAFAIAPTLAAEKTLLNRYYQSLQDKQGFYSSQLQHQDEVNAVAFSPDGRLLVTGSQDEKAKLWSANGELLAPLLHENAVSSVAFSPSGEQILTAAEDATARLWSKAGDSLHVFNHKANVRSAVFSPDGREFLTALDNGTAVLWSISSGDSLAIFGHGFLRLNSAVFSADGQLVLTAGQDGFVRLWQHDGTPVRAIQHGSAVNTAIFSANGEQLLTASSDQTARLWDLTGRALAIFRHADIVHSAIFVENDQKVLTTCEDGRARLWTLSGDMTTEFPHNDAVVTAIVAENGQTIITASRDSTARIWSMDGTLQSVLKHQAAVKAVTFSADGNTVLTGCADHSARLWAARQNFARRLRHPDGVNSVNVSPDGLTILTACIDGYARLWNQNGQEIASFKHNAGLSDAIFSPDGQQVLTASRDKTAKLWPLSGETPLAILQHDSTVYSIDFSRDGSRILTASLDSTVKLWQANGGLLATLKHNGPVYTAHFSPDQRKILTASDDMTAKLWQIDGTLLQTFSHEGEVWSAVFSPDGSKILTAASPYSAILWSARGDSLTQFDHDERVWRAVFAPDGQQILTASFDGTARRWSITGDSLATYSHDSFFIIWQANFSSDGSRIATASEDTKARLWTLAGDTLTTFMHSGSVQRAVFSKDGLAIWTASEDNTAIGWRTAPGIHEWLRRTRFSQMAPSK